MKTLFLASIVALSAFTASASAETVCIGNTCTSTLPVAVDTTKAPKPEQQIACPFRKEVVIEANSACWWRAMAKIGLVRNNINEEDKAKALAGLAELRVQADAYAKIELNDPFDRVSQANIGRFVDKLAVDIDKMN